VLSRTDDTKVFTVHLTLVLALILALDLAEKFA